MFGSNVLEIGIGLVFAYLLLSLTVTAANELMAGLLRSRARDLERGIRNLLDGTSDLPERWWQKARRFIGGVEAPTPGGWSEAFFKHQLINGLSKDAERPSYVASQTFVTVLMHLVQRAAAARDAGQVLAEHQAPPATHPDGTPIPAPWGFASFDAIRDTVLKINNPRVRDALLPLVEEARTDMTDHVAAAKKFNDQVEVWFDHAMDRVGGWYKRRTQWIVFAIALGFTAALNVDSVAISRRLSKNDTLRKAVVESARQYTATQAARQGAAAAGAVSGAPVAPAPVPPPPATLPATLPAGAAASTLPALGSAAAAAAAGTGGQDFAASLARIEAEVGQLNGLALPIGWRYLPPPAGTKVAPPDDDNFYNMCYPGFFLTKLLGLLLTAFAASLGAPFWFDVLNKFMQVRGAGKAPEEKPKDPKAVLQPQPPQATPAPLR